MSMPDSSPLIVIRTDSSLKIGSGDITYHEIIKYIPEDRLMIETDSPYLIPHNINFKHDGINEPSYLIYVVETIAKCLNKDINYIKDRTFRNTKLFFNINE